MKKYFLGLFAILVAITLNSFTVTPLSQTDEDPLNWYRTDEDGRVLTTSPVILSEEKSAVKASVGCSDQSEEFCYYGTQATSLAENFDASDEPEEQIIMRTPN
jgi:hypothetical protein